MSGTAQLFRSRITADQAVTLWKLVAQSDYRNGLGQLYADLAEFVRDVNGTVPGNIGYLGPTWDDGFLYGESS